MPRTLSQAIFEATAHPRGPVYVSVPLDDWMEPALDDDALLLARSVDTSGGAAPEPLAETPADKDAGQGQGN